jgi:hypothetical protein
MAKNPQRNPHLTPRDWSGEFRQLGTDQVRAKLLGTDWNRDKKAAARIWIETQDALSWQQKRGGADSRPSFFIRLRSAKWWKYVAPTAGLLMGFGLLLRRLKAF